MTFCRPASLGRIRCRTKRLGFFLGLACTLGLCCLAGNALGSPKSDNATASEHPKPEWINPPAFKYSAKGKVDPFASFLRTSPEHNTKDRPPERSLSPLDRVEPSQLKLVGTLLAAGDQRLALVQLPNGKGYILHPGMSIGRSQGRVTRIGLTEVTIVEEQTTILGRTTTHRVILDLQKPSEGTNAQ